MSVNIPDNIPAFTVLSFNLNGAVSNPHEKLKYIFDEHVREGCKSAKADLLLFQETRFATILDLRKAFWPYRGELKGLSMYTGGGKSRGVIAWIPGDSVL